MIGTIFPNHVNRLSLRENLLSLVSMESSKNSLPSIDGLRMLLFVSTISIHMFLFSWSTIDNVQYLLTFADDLLIQPVSLAILTIDMFFLLSGFLNAYSFCEQERKRPSRNLSVAVVRKIVNRYIRMNPIFMIVRLHNSSKI